MKNLSTFLEKCNREECLAFGILLGLVSHCNIHELHTKITRIIIEKYSKIPRFPTKTHKKPLNLLQKP